MRRIAKVARVIERADREAVAEKLGIGRRASDKWLSGSRLPSRKNNPQKLADALGLEVEEMMAELSRRFYAKQRGEKNI